MAKSQRELRQVANDLEQVIEYANAPIFGVDSKGCINEWNRKAAELTGFSNDEVMGQHLVSKFGDTLLGGNVHTATAIDARAIPAPKRERHLVADNTPEAGMLGAVNISIYGDHWRKPVLDLFGAQRYKPRTQGYHHGSYPPPPPPPAEEIEENFLHGTPPSDWIFPPTPLPANTCVAALEKLCGASSSQTGRASDCTSCAGQHLIELVGAGCTDAFVVAFCSK